MLRISEERLGEISIMHVAGRLCGEGVEALSHACRDAKGRLRLDLSGLLQVDEVGLALIHSLHDSGAELSGVSPFIQILLENRRSDAV